MNAPPWTPPETLGAAISRILAAARFAGFDNAAHPITDSWTTEQAAALHKALGAAVAQTNIHDEHERWEILADVRASAHSLAMYFERLLNPVGGMMEMLVPSGRTLREVEDALEIAEGVVAALQARTDRPRRVFHQLPAGAVEPVDVDPDALGIWVGEGVARVYLREHTSRVWRYGAGVLGSIVLYAADKTIDEARARELYRRAGFEVDWPTHMDRGPFDRWYRPAVANGGAGWSR